MTSAPPAGFRDRRIEDRSNIWLIHPAGAHLAPRCGQTWYPGQRCFDCRLADRHRRGALLLSLGEASPAVLLGFALSIAWLIADGLDGMVARATGTASALGRLLDGICDHGVFILIYVAMAISIGTKEGWALALSAGAAHIVQSSVFEGERARFHRRLRRLPRSARRRFKPTRWCAATIASPARLTRFPRGSTTRWRAMVASPLIIREPPSRRCGCSPCFPQTSACWRSRLPACWAIRGCSGGSNSCR